MNWRPIVSFILGFAMMPVPFGLIGLFVYLGVAYKLDRGLVQAGAVTGCAVLLLVIAIGVSWIALHVNQ